MTTDETVAARTLTVDEPKLGGVTHFRFERDGEALRGFVVNHSGALFAYVNRCPHVTYSLDIVNGNVQDKTGQFLMCHSHGAMFLPESGECFMGPVVGRRLEQLECSSAAGRVTVRISDEPEGWPHDYHVD